MQVGLGAHGSSVHVLSAAGRRRWSFDHLPFFFLKYVSQSIASKISITSSKSLWIREILLVSISTAASFEAKWKEEQTCKLCFLNTETERLRNRKNKEKFRKIKSIFQTSEKKSEKETFNYISCFLVTIKEQKVFDFITNIDIGRHFGRHQNKWAEDWHRPTNFPLLFACLPQLTTRF